MRDWKIHPAAQEELREAIRYYAGIDSSLALAFEAIYQDYLTRVRENPYLYRPRKFQARRANFTSRFHEWYLAYMIWREHVVILAIGHAKRRPYYWRHRIDQSRRLF